MSARGGRLMLVCVSLAVAAGSLAARPSAPFDQAARGGQTDETPPSPQSAPASNSFSGPDGTDPARSGVTATDAADRRRALAAQRYYALLALLASLGIVLLSVVLLSRVLQSWRRRLLAERSESRRTPYVDAWAESRVTDEQIRAATLEDETERDDDPPHEEGDGDRGPGRG